MRSLRSGGVALGGLLALLVAAPAPTFAQGEPDAGPDPCDDCGPDLRCIEVEGELFCGECAPGEERPCADCPPSERQTCGGDLFWDPCKCVAGCGAGPPCGPGLQCIEDDGDFFCGVCSPGDTRDCDSGCGEGVETCEGDFFWGRCLPTDAVECNPGEQEPCDSDCGSGHRECDATSCTWSDRCVPDAVTECATADTRTCTVVGSCQGTQTCNDECAWSACIPPPGGCHACGDGIVDDGEDCDDGNLDPEDGCSPECEWEDARPFRSCDCRMPGASGGDSGSFAMLAAALAVGLFGLIARRGMR